MLIMGILQPFQNVCRVRMGRAYEQVETRAPVVHGDAGCHDYPPNAGTPRQCLLWQGMRCTRLVEHSMYLGSQGPVVKVGHRAGSSEGDVYSRYMRQ